MYSLQSGWGFFPAQNNVKILPEKTPRSLRVFWGQNIHQKKKKNQVSQLEILHLHISCQISNDWQPSYTLPKKVPSRKVEKLWNLCALDPDKCTILLFMIFSQEMWDSRVSHRRNKRVMLPSEWLAREDLMSDESRTDRWCLQNMFTAHHDAKWVGRVFENNAVRRC